MGWITSIGLTGMINFALRESKKSSIIIAQKTMNDFVKNQKKSNLKTYNSKINIFRRKY